MELMIGEVIEMEELIQENFLHDPERKREFFMNNPIQQTLRRNIEECRLEN